MYIYFQLYSNYNMYMYFLITVNDIEDIISQLATTSELTGIDMGIAIATKTSDPLITLGTTDNPHH